MGKGKDGQDGTLELILICFGATMEEHLSSLFSVSCPFKETTLEATTFEAQHETSILFWLLIEMLVQLLHAAPCCLETRKHSQAL